MSTNRLLLRIFRIQRVLHRYELGCPQRQGQQVQRRQSPLFCLLVQRAIGQVSNPFQPLCL